MNSTTRNFLLQSTLFLLALVAPIGMQPIVIAQSESDDQADPGGPSQPRLVSVKRIWDQAPHNAFTDLLFHQGRWYCVFREGSRHVSPDGSLRILGSEDGETWTSIALVTDPVEDLRDAKLSVTPDGRLMLNGAGMQADQPIRYHSMVWFSADQGNSWTDGKRIGDPGFWLWRAQWHNDVCYSMGYATGREREKRSARFYRSSDGANYDALIPEVNLERGVGEDVILFLEDDSALCLFRHETGDKMAFLGKSNPPYDQWQWTSMNARIGGPDMIQLPDGRILAAVRLYDGKVRTSLTWLDPENATLTECLTLPSGGDTSYAGLVWKDDMLWVSYYSSHEEKTAIYLAKVVFE
ncbi:glycoside hydrolase [Stieleria sp. TO1_6]|uniref:sialidase family protein n=1 Tax=Stieleria tagensis TaxID=2956795 RepID=UPI00209A97A4|nr:sialidase family protein [Stieleria tagensis]MCO8122940.1 glycoside hydrolase [Stieleria tagensis]